MKKKNFYFILAMIFITVFILGSYRLYEIHDAGIAPRILLNDRVIVNKLAYNETLKEIQQKLEKLFKGWKKGNIPIKNIATVADKEKSIVYLVECPGSQQSIIFAGHLASPRNNNQEEEIQMMNNILGGNFMSRINMNLREDKYWTYGAQSFILGAKGQRPFIAYSPVQSDKTAESMQEILNELTDITESKPPTVDEPEKNRLNELLGVPGSRETISSVAGSASEVVQYGLPDDYFKVRRKNPGYAT